jgi:hypothetical protein
MLDKIEKKQKEIELILEICVCGKNMNRNIINRAGKTGYDS